MLIYDITASRVAPPTMLAVGHPMVFSNVCIIGSVRFPYGYNTLKKLTSVFRKFGVGGSGWGLQLQQSLICAIAGQM